MTQPDEEDGGRGQRCRNVMKRYKPISLRKVRRYCLEERNSKMEAGQTGGVFCRGASFAEFMNTIPPILAGNDIRAVAEAIVNARRNDRPVILAMGAHPIKVGLSPLIIDLIETGVITALSTNGAAIIHDFELAFMGRTSEDVAHQLADGSFGMAKETGNLINRAIKAGVKKGLGIGESVGVFINSERACRHRELSIFAAACRHRIPATVHVALGTDIIHMHPEADGAMTGEGSMIDFRLLASVVADLEGGVFLNLGSAVIIPEVFLKALTVARNLGHRVERITTVTMDFTRQYRAMENVLKRPTMKGGKAYFITGHHEINFPLLAAMIKELE